MVNRGLHSLVVSLMVKDIPLLMVGLPRHVNAVTQAIQPLLEPSVLHKYPVDLFIPSDQCKPYSRQRMQIVICGTVAITYPVCFSLLACMEGRGAKQAT